MDRRHRVLYRSFISALLVLICTVMCASDLCVLRSADAKAEVRGDLTGRFEEPRTITMEGQSYRYRNDLTTVLFMGIDKTSEQGSAISGFRSGGQADFLLLMALDSKAEKITLIQVDRDTMTRINIVSVLGEPAGTRNAQICLSHGFGDGKEQSCLFTVEAVSGLLRDIEIDFYVAMNLDGIHALNEALGGVTVTLEDDFTALDPDMNIGETITLRGKQAEYYVRYRMGIGEGTNAARMVRQRNYLGKVGAMIDEKLRDNANFVGRLFDALDENLTTDMSRGRMINEAYASRNYQRTEMIYLRGEHLVNDGGFVEFHADERGLDELVLDVFFEPVDAP